MTIKMSPKRWLIVTLAAAGAYSVYLLASAADGILNVPTQLNSMILWILGTAAVISSVIAAWTELAARNEERRSAEMAEHARHLGAQLDAIRRDVRALVLRSPTGQFPALQVVGTAAVAPSAEVTQHAEVTAIADRIARRLAGPDDH